MIFTDTVVQNAVHRIVKGDDYVSELYALIDVEFQRYAIEFLGKIVKAKVQKESINGDWYLREFRNAGVNRNNLVLNHERTASHPTDFPVKDDLILELAQLTEANSDLGLTLTLKFRGVSVELNLSETLIVVNALAVKRAALRGGAWSTAGKRVEKMLFQTLCLLYHVPKANLELTGFSDMDHELDFVLIAQDGRRLSGEIKLMGRGNPESISAALAHQNDVFIADTLSDLNQRQLDERGIAWIELRSPQGFRKFFDVLGRLNVPCSDFAGELDARLTEIFVTLFPV